MSGSARGQVLVAPKDRLTRPISDRVKEALFGSIGARILDARVLDLYAGSGAIGIEALSRGAATADFVEQNAGVCAIIADNLAHTRLAEQGRVHRAKVSAYLARLTAAPPLEEARFDLVFLDPPYAAPDIVEVLLAVTSSPAVAPDALIIVGHSVRVALPDQAGTATRLQRRCHGDSCFSIYTKASVALPVGREGGEA